MKVVKIIMGIVSGAVIVEVASLWFDGRVDAYSIGMKIWMSFLCTLLIGVNILAWKLTK